MERLVHPESNERTLAEDHREVYLAEVSSVLSKKVTPLQAYETIQEMRTHIDAMAAAYVELGLEPPDAMAAALSKFGKPKRIAFDFAGALAERAEVSRPIGWLATVALESLMGAAVFQLIEFFFDSQFAVNTNPVTDMAAGAIVGGAIGAVAWFWKRSPNLFGLLLCIPLQVLLALQLFSSVMALGRPERYFEIAVVLSLATYFVGVAGVRVAGRLREGLPIPTIARRRSLK